METIPRGIGLCCNELDQEDAVVELTHAQLGDIMLRTFGADACLLGYGTTDPEAVGQHALQFGDINRDGTLN